MKKETEYKKNNIEEPDTDFLADEEVEKAFKEATKMVRKECRAAKKKSKNIVEKETDCGGIKPYDLVEPLTKEERRFRNFLMDYDHEIEFCKMVLASDVSDDAKQNAKMRIKEAEKNKKYMLDNKDKLLGKKN